MALRRLGARNVTKGAAGAPAPLKPVGTAAGQASTALAIGSAAKFKALTQGLMQIPVVGNTFGSVDFVNVHRVLTGFDDAHGWEVRADPAGIGLTAAPRGSSHAASTCSTPSEAT
jgi:hypothetical protein